MPEPTLTTQPGLDTSVTIGTQNLPSPRELNREIWHPDRHDLADALLRALRQLVGDEPRVNRQATLVEEYNVTALSTESDGRIIYTYARMAGYALDSQSEWLRLLKTTRQLGTMTDYGQSSLQDVVEGPIQILAAADVDMPRLEVDLRGLFDLKSNQRVALLDYLFGLTQGVALRIIVSNRVRRRLLDQHRDQLPASVIENAESNLHGLSHVAARTADRRQCARDILCNRPTDHLDWKRLKVVYDAPQQRMSYDELERDLLADIPSRDALKKFVARMREDDLLEAYGSPHDRHVRLTPTGYALLDEHPTLSVGGEDLSRGGAGRTDDTTRTRSAETDPSQTTVSDPPNLQDSSVYFPPTHERGGKRPTNEAATATAGGSGDGSLSHVKVDYMDGDEHDAAVSMAKTGEIALCDSPADTSGDSRAPTWSYLEERDEVVVRIEDSGWKALTMVRLCSALLSEPAFQQVLTRDRLAGGPDRHGLGGLPVEAPVVLRDGGCLGYLKNEDATAKRYRQRLRQARNELEAMTAEIEFGVDADEDAIAELIKQAHGLAGTATRIYDMLGVDVHRVLDVPTWALEDDDRRENVIKMIAKQTSVSSRYGVYSAERVLYEPREDKREQLLGTPDISPADPTGDICGSWVLVGEDVNLLHDDLESLDESLILQENGEHFAPFVLDVDVVDGNRRSAYATALARRCTLKHIESTRQTVSILRAMTRDVFAAAYGIRRGLATEHDDIGRDFDQNEIRAALSVLDPDDILPDLGPRSVSEAVQVLVDVDESISTSDLVDLMDSTSTRQTLRDNNEIFDELEAAGLLERTDLGPGKATLWRLRLPFDAERRQESAMTPRFVVGTSTKTGSKMQPTEALAELFFTLGDDLGHDPIDFGSDYFFQATTGLAGEQNLGPLLRRHPEHRPLVRLVIQLMGEDIATFVDDQETILSIQASISVQFGQEPDPELKQVSLLQPAVD